MQVEEQVVQLRIQTLDARRQVSTAAWYIICLSIFVGTVVVLAKVLHWFLAMIIAGALTSAVGFLGEHIINNLVISRAAKEGIPVAGEDEE